MIEAIIYYLVLLDAVIANIIAWCDGKWYAANFRIWSKRLPITKWWAGWYIVLMLWVGWALLRLNVLWW